MIEKKINHWPGGRKQHHFQQTAIYLANLNLEEQKLTFGVAGDLFFHELKQFQKVGGQVCFFKIR